MTTEHCRQGARPGWAATIARAGLGVALAFLLSACASSEPGGGGDRSAAGTNDPPAAMASPATQTSEGGQVAVKVTWPGRPAGPTFTVAMDTHSVDLDAYDLRRLAVLRLDQGQEVRPTNWDAPKGGHHRAGTLTFPATTGDGSQLIGPATRTIELVIRDVAGVPERTFRWALN